MAIAHAEIPAGAESRPFSAPDGAELHHLVWRPPGPATGQVVVAHGYAEHGARYGELAGALQARGWTVHALDQAGHGRSPGARGLVDRAEAWTDALTRLLEELQAEAGPIGLVGHSFGGTVVARVAQLRPDLIDALVLVAPFLRSALGHPRWLVRTAAWGSRLAPGLPTARLPSWRVAGSEAARRAYRDDPLVYGGRIPLATSRELHALGEVVLRDAARLQTPLLVMHGADDAIADPAGSEALIAAAAAEDRTLRVVAGGHHELLNDDDGPLRESLAGWLADRFR